MNTKHSKHRLSRPASAGLFYTAASVTERASAIIMTPIYTRLLLPEQYGVFSVYNTLFGILTVFATLEICGSSIYRAYKEFDSDNSFLASAIGLMGVCSLITLLAVFIFYEGSSTLSALPKPILVLLIFEIFLFGVRSLMTTRARYTYKVRPVLFSALFFSLGTPLISVMLIKHTALEGYSRIYASFILSLLYSVPILAVYLKKGKMRLFSRPVWSFLLKYSLPALPHYLAISSLFQLGKLVYASSFSSAEVALFALGISVGFIPSLISSGMQSVILPWLNRKLCEGKIGRERLYSLIYSVLPALIISTVLFLLVIPEIFSLLVSTEYQEALNVIYPIAASVPISFLFSVFAGIISHTKKTYYITFGSVAGAVFNLVCNLLFTSTLGMMFSAILIPISTGIVFLSYALILKYRLLHSEVKISRLLSYVAILFLLVLLSYFLMISLYSRLLFSLALILAILPKAKEFGAILFERA